MIPLLPLPWWEKLYERQSFSSSGEHWGWGPTGQRVSEAQPWAGLARSQSSAEERGVTWYQTANAEKEKQVYSCLPRSGLKGCLSTLSKTFPLPVATTLPEWLLNDKLWLMGSQLTWWAFPGLMASKGLLGTDFDSWTTTARLAEKKTQKEVFWGNPGKSLLYSNKLRRCKSWRNKHLFISYS